MKDKYNKQFCNSIKNAASRRAAQGDRPLP